ncbi:MAG: cellulase N-terminal Ig-like domain-containing protein [Gemmataceae bacterium]
MMRTTLLAVLLAALALAAEPAVRIDDFGKPFLFSYLAWQNKVRTEGGKAILRGITPQGGAGQNISRDLSRHPDWSPYLRVTVHPDNKARALKLLLRDASERPGSWMFRLPTKAGDAVLAPEDGAPLSHPSQVEHKGAPELARISQLQLIGDFGKEQPLSVTVHAVTAGPPTVEVVRLRQAGEAKRREEAARRERERQNLVARHGKRGPDSPTVTHVSAAAPDVLSLTIVAGRITPSKLTRYTAQPGDKQEKDGEGIVLNRDGKRVGWLIGVKKDDLVTFERFAGDPLLDFLADDAATFTVRSTDDPAFTDATRPTAAHRKSRPLDWAQPSNDFVMEHTVYLRLPHRLMPGKRYTVDLGKLNTREPQATLTFDPATVRSEAIHVSQVGFRPDDPVKEGRLSLWMGTGGGCDYAACRTFRLVTDADGETAYTGKVEPHWPVDKSEKLQRTENFVKARSTASTSPRSAPPAAIGWWSTASAARTRSPSPTTCGSGRSSRR